MPEHATQRTRDAGTHVVAEQIERRGLASCPARPGANPAAGDRMSGKKTCGEEHHPRQDQPEGVEGGNQQSQQHDGGSTQHHRAPTQPVS